MPQAPHVSSKGDRFYILVLITGVGLGSFGVLLSRPILQDGPLHLPWAETLQFNYPYTITFIRLFLSFVLLVLAGFFPAIGDQASTPNSRRRWSAAQNFNLDDEPVGNNVDEEDYASSFRQPSWKHLPFDVLWLAIGVAAQTIFGAHVLFNSPVEVYFLSLGLAIPIFLVLLKLIRIKSWTVSSAVADSSISAFITISVGTIIACYRSGVILSSNILWKAVLLATTTAVCTLQMEYTSKLQGILPRVSEQYRTVASSDGELSGSTVRPSARATASSRRLLSQISLVGAVIIAPVLLWSGELGHISRNCYFLNEHVFWAYILLGAICCSILLVSTVLLVQETSASFTIFWSLFVNIIQLPLFGSSKISSWQLVGLGVCLIAGLLFVTGNEVFSLNLAQRSQRINFSNYYSRLPYRWVVAGVVILSGAGFVGFTWSSGEASETNSFLPLVRGEQGYLGARPHALTHANLTLLVEHCRGSYSDPDLILDYRSCLDFLSANQKDYLYIPDSQPSAPQQSNETSPICEGPIIPFHLWWTGPPSWRTELFIKSYLFTQNLPCSRLWIWLNTDQHPTALQTWRSSPKFRKFMPFLDTGDIALKEWSLPSRVPLPEFKDLDPLDRARFYTSPNKPNSKGETIVADSIIRDSSGKDWLQIYPPNAPPQIITFTVAVSDAARLIILHLHGGVYLDVDMILLRDLRPLLLPSLPFAERWGEHEWYNNALVALPAMSSISSYILWGGVRIGLSYHFKALYRILVAEGRDDISTQQGLFKFENAFFDPAGALVAENEKRGYKCAVPCFSDFASVFKAVPKSGEWAGFNGNPVVVANPGENNRTVENFFKGAWAYHIHNQVSLPFLSPFVFPWKLRDEMEADEKGKWSAKYEPGSWMDVICSAHDAFLSGAETNPYGEKWSGPEVEGYRLLSP
ncbi:hypothetical protein G7Y89_g13807 [Cudoniella acicularis]|uniref:Glycosyltransferase family 32 protein n=1 Tax=Cudoniella acicularis TaxID=354080 RepID=A0A8H4R681_9HELO|nr:hypothetical protein G7Y89_g13807 [Cudoniella acicularis]